MQPHDSFAAITSDSGLVSEVLHVSPVFVRFGPQTRGRFAGQRLARIRRTEARWARRAAPVQPEPDLGYARWRLDA